MKLRRLYASGSCLFGSLISSNIQAEFFSPVVDTAPEDTYQAQPIDSLHLFGSPAGTLATFPGELILADDSQPMALEAVSCGPVTGPDVTGYAGTDIPEQITIDSPLGVSAGDSKINGDIDASVNGTDSADFSLATMAQGTGVDAAGGDDSVAIDDRVTVCAAADTTAGMVTLSLFDSASANTSLSAEAMATGIYGGTGVDWITSSDTIEVSSKANALGLSLDANLLDVDRGLVDATLGAGTVAFGIDGGDDDDTLTNSATLLVTSESFAGNLSISASLVGNGSLESQLLSTAVATGIGGATGADVIRNDSKLTVSALAKIQSGDLTFALAQGLGTLDAGVSGIATAVGLDGDVGDDSLVNTDAIEVTARTITEVHSINVSVAALDPLSEEGAALAGPDMFARATGIAGGAGMDTITNDGTVTVTAAPDPFPDPTDPDPVENDTVVQVIDAAAFGNARAVAGAQTTARATGIDGGMGVDTINNNGTLDVSASPDATILVASGGLDLVPVIPVILIGADADLAVSAQTYGISAGYGDDIIANGGLIKATSDADLTTVEARVKLGISTSSGGGGGNGGDGGGTSAVSATTDVPAADGEAAPTLTIIPPVVTADAVRQSGATGIGGDAGNDTITNAATGTIKAAADVLAVDVTGVGTLDVKVVTSSALTAALQSVDSVASAGTVSAATTAAADDGDDDALQIDAESLIEVLAAGIDGGEGNDTIHNLGTIEARANAQATAVTGKVAISIPSDVPSFFIPTVALQNDASATIAADAVGITGGGDNDALTNDGMLTVEADSGATSVTGSLDTKILIPIPISFLDMRADASSATLATAAGMRGDPAADDPGQELRDDVITNNSALKVTADATAHAVSVVGALGGASFGTATTTVGAEATGIDGGDGDDRITNTGKIDSWSSATAGDFGLQVSLLLGAAVGSVNANVAAQSTGIQGGADNDVIRHTAAGDLYAKAASDADVTQVDVAVFPGATIASAVAKSRATAAGINGGAGNDDILAEGTVRAEAAATVSARAFGVALISTGFDDFPLPQGATAQSAGTKAFAKALGIGGDAGNDVIGWLDRVDVDAAAHADTLMLAAVGTGASLGEATVLSRAFATGVFAGTGDDGVEGRGVVTADATATAGSVSIGVSGVAGSGGASGSADATVAAEATGIDGGLGSDVIDVFKNVHATACATSGPDGADPSGLGDQCPPADLTPPLAGATGISVSLTHGGMNRLTALTDATATAVTGGEANDRMTNSSALSAFADAEGRSGSVAVTLLGGAASTVTTAISATATGMDGGGGDDQLINKGSITAAAESFNKDVSVDVDVVGASLVDMSTSATATAIGMKGGEGRDDIRNEKSVAASAVARARGIAVEVDALLDVAGIYGDSKLDEVDTSAKAYATGISGGGGDDLLTVTGTTHADATSEATATFVVYSTGGSLVNEGGLVAIAEAVGLDGGDGHDWIYSNNSVFVNAHSSTGATSVDVTGAGKSTADAETSITADALAIDGGDDDDVIDITGMLSAIASASTTDTGWSVVLAGEGSQTANLVVAVNAGGAFGGSGNDSITNAVGNRIDANASATGTSNQVNVDLAGATRGEAGFEAGATVAGMRGGAGLDSLLNLGVIDGDAMSTATFSNVDFTLGGVATSVIGNADTVAATLVTGMAGDAGDDWLQNAATIDLDTTATVETTKDSSIVVFGVAGASATVAARAAGIGMDGGTDDDAMENLALIDVESRAIANLLDGSEFTFGGVASDTAEIATRATAIGIGGGSGIDRVDNAGAVRVLADSAMDVGSGSKVVFGKARSAGLGTTKASAVGIAGGEDADEISNRATVEAEARTRIHSRDTAYAFAGNPSANPAVSSESSATGIAAGEGDDRISNAAGAAITVTAAAKLTTSGDSRASFDFGRVSGSAKLDAAVTARGAYAGMGNDSMVNFGAINVVADSDTRAINTSQAGIFLGNVNSTAIAVANIQAWGMDAGDDNNEVYNSGEVEGTLTVFGTGPDEGPTALAISKALGGNITITSDANAAAKATLGAELRGLGAGNGANRVVNTGRVTIGNAPEVEANAQADGDGFDGDGSATATVRVGSSDPNDPNDPPRTLSAVGIEVGNGNNTLINSGILDVSATPKGIARGNADGDLFGSAVATLDSTVHALAVGIKAGNGSNQIVNEATIAVSAAPTAEVIVTAGSPAGSGASAVSNSVGILAGDGGNVIHNSGNIHVQADATTVAPAKVSTSSVSNATAILSGSGADEIVNKEGGILKVTVSGSFGAGAGIDAGAGDDLVRLLHNSAVYGDVLLGTGDDSLVWGSAAVLAGVAYANSGSDTFILGDDFDGTFDQSELGDHARFRGFELFRKQGTSTWTLTFDRTIDWTVDAGTLVLDADIVGTIQSAVGAQDPSIAVLAGSTLRALGTASPVILNGGGVLFNQGRVEALNNAGDQVAVQLFGTGNMVVNEGEIEAAGAGGAQGIGIQVAGDRNAIHNFERVINSGSIGAAISLTGSANSVSNAGLIEGMQMALDIQGAAAFVSNNGEIRSLGSDGQPGFGIRLQGDDGSIVNNGNVRSVAREGAAVALLGRGGSIINRGSISAEQSTGVWIDSMHGADNKLLNELGASIGSDAGVAVLGGAGNERVENFGRLTGGSGTALALGAGRDTLLLASTSQILGNADAGAGADTFILGGRGDARFDLNQITRKYLGFEEFRKEGASTWTLTGSADGPWTVATGGILLEGTLSGDVLVEALGLLGGSGTAGSVRNYGTVAPGSSIGILTVSTNYVHEASGELETELDGSGRSDLVRVGGRATLKGGTVKVIPLEEPGISTEYSILTAGKGVSGVFDSAYSTWSILDPYLQYEPNRVLLMVIRNDISFASFARTANQWTVGWALDANVLDPTKKAATRGDFKRVVDEFLVLSPDEASRALDALSGELHATVQSTLLRSGGRFLSIAADRQLSAASFSSRGKRLWVDALGFRGTVDDDGNASGADYRTGGIAAGFDFAVKPGLHLGGALGYSKGDIDLDRVGAGSANIESYHFGLYGEYIGKPWRLQGAAAYSRHGIETGRDINYGSIARRAEADYNADQYGAYVRGSYDLRGPGGSLLQPFASLAYSQLKRDSFRESGAYSLDLDVDDETTTSLYTSLGARAVWDLQWRQVRISPELRLGWAHQFLDQNGEITANFAATPRAAGYQSFRVRGVETGRDSLVVGAGVTAEVRKNARLFLSYDGAVNGDQTEHALLGGVRVTW